MAVYNRLFFQGRMGAMVQGWGGMGAERIGENQCKTKINHKTGPSSTDPSKRNKRKKWKQDQHKNTEQLQPGLIKHRYILQIPRPDLRTCPSLPTVITLWESATKGKGKLRERTRETANSPKDPSWKTKKK